MAGFGRHFFFAVVLCMVIITVCAQPSTTLTDRVSSFYQPFGVQDDTIITDGQMTASSQLNGSEAFRGRLNGDGAWQPSGPVSGQGTESLAVDLLYARYIFGIQTQGQGDGYIETYRVIYQRDNTSNVILYSEGGGSAKIFTGNSDDETIVQNNFTPYIYARYILVNPQTFSGASRLRVELLGVDELPITSFPTTTPSWTTTQSAVTTTTSTTPLLTSSATTTSTRTAEAGTASQGPNTAVTGN
ncbi:retinoschisin-like [Branchiostoma lanceolatum]|uniref:retinoschisin-like n=1 Tax=Branchiostoma lanceolatum TaxID=7740 RepID=UPI0034558AE8